MTVILLVSIPGYLVVAGIYNYLFLLKFYIPFASAGSLAAYCSLPGGGT